MATIDGTTISDLPNRMVDYRLIQTAAMRAATTVTTSYVVSTNVVKCGFADRISFGFAFVWAAATSVDWYHEWSFDGTTWFLEDNQTTTGATTTEFSGVYTKAVGASQNFISNVKVLAPYVRTYVKAPAATSDTVAITACLLSL